MSSNHEPAWVASPQQADRKRWAALRMTVERVPSRLLSRNRAPWHLDAHHLQVCVSASALSTNCADASIPARAATREQGAEAVGERVDVRDTRTAVWRSHAHVVQAPIA